MLGIKSISNNIFKNLTPRQIALYSSVFLTVVFGIGYLILSQAHGTFSLFELLLLLVFSYFIHYITILFVLQKYVYRRVKLIYKVIQKQKSSFPNSSDSINPDDDILKNVEDDVKEWALSQEEEIKSLKSLERYRRNYIGNVSHELKTPIFNLQGYLHTLRDGGIYDPDINEKYLDKALSNLDRLTTIIEDLDLITKLESEEFILNIETFDIHNLIVEVFEDFELQASKKQIKMVFGEGANNHFMVSADKESIRQVLSNLIGNSIKYGSISGRTKVGLYDMNHFILVEVADNGNGIEEKHLKHLYDRFYRVDKSRSRSVGGSGLGLSIVKHIIEAHKQTINVRSTPGLGSTFGFTLKKVE